MNEEYAEATMKLRFVRRDGKLILQQEWVGPTNREWRDVPLVEEASFLEGET